MRKTTKGMIVTLLLCTVFLSGCGSHADQPEHSAAASPSAEVSLTAAPASEEPTSEPTSPPTPEPAPEPTPVPALEESFPLHLGFSSGAGGWGTEIIIQQDLSFAGKYTDSNMGDSGEGYDGSQYICTFNGQFTDLIQIDEYSYSLTLSTLTSDYEDGKEWIESGTRYISAAPYGLESGTEFILYLPNAPTDGLSEEFLSWWPGRYDPEVRESGMLNFFGLYNVEMGYGFFGQSLIAVPYV